MIFVWSFGILVGFVGLIIGATYNEDIMPLGLGMIFLNSVLLVGTVLSKKEY